MPEGWQWDETLYQGSAPYYVRGRLPYAPGLAGRFAETLGLDGRGRLIDVGCGPGVLALSLAHLFAEVVGVDPDPGMLAEAAQRAQTADIRNVRWVRARAEELTADLGPFQVATFGQSFHWMDRDRVAALMRTMLAPGGAFVHVADVKDEVPQPENFPHPAPPYAAIQALVEEYLGPVRRAGQGVLPSGTPDREADVLRRSGFGDPVRLRIPAGNPIVRTADDLAAWVFSRSLSAPQLFGADRTRFESDLRALLEGVSPGGLFAEQPPDTDVLIWRNPRR